MANEHDYLNPFRSQNGSTSSEGQKKAGEYEKSQGWQPAPQQSHESHEAYISRVNWDR